MHPATTPQRPIFPAAGTGVSDAFTPPAPGPEQVLIQTRWWLLSTGTESIVVCRGLRIVDAHDGHEDARWHSGRIVPFCFQQVATGRFRLQGLTTHTFAPRACTQAYGLVEAPCGATTGICFDGEA